MRLRDFLYECEPHIVHTFLLTASLYGRFAAMLARVPIVVGTEVNIYQNKRPLHALAERWLMRRDRRGGRLGGRRCATSTLSKSAPIEPKSK